jgi:hypothetical protein
MSSVLCIPSPTSAAAAGQKCKRVGQSTSTFRGGQRVRLSCKKVGTRLIWVRRTPARAIVPDVLQMTSTSTTTSTVSLPIATTTSPSTSTSTSTSSTTTTIPYCQANPVPFEQTVFGRAWLSGDYWNIPGADKASRYGAYPRAIFQPSLCQTFSFTGIQTRPTGSEGSWDFVPYVVIEDDYGSAYAKVFDAWGVNMDFRFVYEVYNSTLRLWEIRYVWKSPYSCGYTCDP